MKIKLQTFKLIIYLIDELNITNINNINIFGNIKVQYDGGVYDFGFHNMKLQRESNKFNLICDTDLKSFFKDILEPADLDIFYDNFLWLDYLEFMDVEIDGYSSLEHLFTFLFEQYFSHHKCTCIDIYYCSKCVHSTLKLFKNNIYSKCYYITDDDGSTHVRIVRMKPQVFFGIFEDINFMSLSPNYETPTLAVEVYQLAKYCRLCTDYKFTFNVKEETEC